MNAAQQGQRGALMPWSAVFLGLGVALYFSLGAEPGPAGYAAAALGVAAGAALLAWRREGLGPLGLALALVGAGVLLAGFRAHQASGPVLDFRYYGPVEGRIVGIDRSASDALRLTLDEVRLDDVPPGETPRRVRVSLHGAQDWLDPEPGSRVMMTAHLSPPSGPAEPGGFDFQRHSWFLSLGAVGYTRTPALLAEARTGRAAPLFHLRMRMSQAIRDQIPGQPGAFAAAVLTGDRSGLESGPVEDMRAANIAHLLAISGLHMGLLTGFVYGALRLALALIPWLALRYPVRKWAAAGALAAGAFYLALSGGNVATERAFIQVAVMLIAVMLDRRAVTLRSVAMAALIVLAHRPETLFSPGFQMSFAATAALVSVFNGLRGATWLTVRPAWQKWVFALVMSSLVAGLATAPFAAAHFNRIAVYGLAANLLTVPVMGSLVIPAAVVAALLWPFGLSGWAFAAMEPGLVWILEVARRVAAMPGANDYVASPPAGTLGLIAAGGLVLIIWPGRARWTGLAPLALSALLWSGTGRPLVLVSDTGGLVGVLTAEGRALSRPRGDGFVAGVWLENDGDAATQEEAASREGWRKDGAGMAMEADGLRIWHGPGRRALADASRACAVHDLVILSAPVRDADPPLAAWLPATDAMQRPEGAARAEAVEACALIDPTLLERTGALSISVQDGRLAIRTSRAVQGARPWTRVP
ncbi:ComEC/Rec2 family competence protein [Roseibacterium sp. SDUM158017]|uniref:ComEC/Rec2 family competence protein n=1 Tax=Roseicyclus salinarum TaxID=3036773 RepID=UPI0024154BBD|nr:ComEC/Rec2 family competence protein [Roseibacterium sp. SDUM158017]MDG4647552.1 ComEC/Rec2 family competence protein [Roseibacterium sp. SDUM158017]